MATIPVKPTHDELATRWKEQHKLTAYGMASFYRYCDGCWKEVAESTIENEILLILVEAKAEWIKPTKAMLDSVLEMCRIMVTVDFCLWDSNPNILVCQNGTLEIRERRLREHSPYDYSTRSVPYDYSETATAPTWERLLENLPDDVIPFLQEFAGYCMTPDTHYEIALWLYGPAGCGKSTLLSGFMAMAGPMWCSLGLADFERSRFALAGLPGCTMAISTEQPTGGISSSDLLNKVISGEPIMVEKKYKDAFQILPRVKVLWAMNELPRIKSGENGLFRRIRIISFPPLAASDRDPNFKERVQAEGAGNSNWALDGLDRLRARGRFLIPETIKHAAEEFRASSNILLRFIEEKCIVEDEGTVQANDLYERFVAWCEENNHLPFSSTRSGRMVLEMGFERFMKDGRRFYRGIRLRNKYSDGYE